MPLFVFVLTEPSSLNKMNFKEKYGSTALIAGASEGIGFSFGEALAKAGMNIIMVARRKEPLEKAALEIEKKFSVKTFPVVCDLTEENALQNIQNAIGNTEINVLIYNAALSPIGPFLNLSEEEIEKVVSVNMLAPIKFVHSFGRQMMEKRKGAIVLMTSLAGTRGTGFLAMYSATKAFNQMFAEALWYEWKKKGVDMIACIAGATTTPGYIKSKPKSAGFVKTPLQEPNQVVEECLKKLGKTPSFISGGQNKMAAFFMNKILSRKMSINIMGDSIRKIYEVID